MTLAPAVRNTSLILALLLLGIHPTRVLGQEPAAIVLWPNGAPGSQGKTGDEQVRITELGEHIVSSVHRPSVTPYLPAPQMATGAAVVVIPGGGHRELWMDHEGYRVGRWLSAHGIAAFVLKYRLAKEEGSTYTVEGDALADVQRAIRLVRHQAGTWGVDPDRVGVMGFSAGGELAGLAGTRYGNGPPAAADSVDRESARPAFMALIYPFIEGGLTLPAGAPPAFLLGGDKDIPAVVDRLTSLFAAIRHAGGSAELHILAGAGHGFGIRDNNPSAVAAWPTLFANWLVASGVVTLRSTADDLSPQMRAGIATARPVPVYSGAERAEAARKLFALAEAPVLGAPTSLTPNAPYGLDGATCRSGSRPSCSGLPAAARPASTSGGSTTRAT